MTLEDGEFSVENMPFNTAQSSLQAAHGWANAPGECKRICCIKLRWSCKTLHAFF